MPSKVTATTFNGNATGGGGGGGNTLITPDLGGTGIDNGTNTLTYKSNIVMTMAGATSLAYANSFTTSGNFGLTLTTTGTTNVTFPTSGTLLTTNGTFTGTYNGGVIAGTYGGTGVNNGSKTITLANNFSTTGNFDLILTTTGATNVTLPTTGTLLTTTGTYVGTVIPGTYGGTGVNNGTKTITLANNFSTSGNFGLILTTTGATNVTLPTTGTLLTTTGTYVGTVIPGTYGGTGVNNGSKTITLANNVATSGNFGLTLTTIGTTNVTLPTSGILATTTVGSFTAFTATLNGATNTATNGSRYMVIGGVTHVWFVVTWVALTGGSFYVSLPTSITSGYTDFTFAVGYCASIGSDQTGSVHATYTAVYSGIGFFVNVSGVMETATVTTNGYISMYGTYW